MSKPDHLSISALKLHQYSPAKYVLTYVEGLRDPPTHHLEFGKRIHSEIEDIIQKDLLPDNHRRGFYEQWKEDNKNWIQRSDWNVEAAFRTYIDSRLPPFEGRIDLWRNGENGIVEIVDHKTATKGFELSPEDLLNDWQLSLYSHALDPFSTFRKGDFLAAKIGHNQLFKNKKMELIGYRYIEESLSGSRQAYNIEKIIEEGLKILTTIATYDKIGLKGVEKGQANPKYFGRDDFHWPLINGEIGLDEFKRKQSRN